MKGILKARVFPVWFLAATIFSFAPVGAKSEGNYILTTASTGGTYYPVGVAISTLIKVKLQSKQKIGMSAIPSAGSGENVKLLNENEAQFGILQGLYGYFAREGVGPFEKQGPQRGIYAVTMLWPNVEHFSIAKEFVKTGTFADIANVKGMKAALGRKNSGTLGSNTVLLRSLGLDADKDFELFHAGYGPSMTALADGRVVLSGTPAGDPVGAVTNAFAAAGDSLRLLSFDKEQLEKANEGYGVWSSYVVKAGTYPGLDEDLNTIAQPNFLAVREDVPADDVFKILEAVYSNLGFLKNIHQATKTMSLDPNADGVSTAIAGLPLKLHPGALLFYESQGVEVPASLR